MTIAISTDYWLYTRALICNTTNLTAGDDGPPHRGGSGSSEKKDPGGLTHSGLWRICCLEGLKRGVCVKINHFPEDTDYDHDSAEYLLRTSGPGLQHLPDLERHPAAARGRVRSCLPRLQIQKEHHPGRGDPVRGSRPEQHHRGDRVHIGQRGRAGPQEGRGEEKPLLVRLVLLLWRVVLHPGRSDRRAGRQHLHRAQPRGALSISLGPAQGRRRRGRQWRERPLGHPPSAQLPLPLPPPLPLQLPRLQRGIAVAGRVSRRPRGSGLRLHGHLHVHAQSRPVQGQRGCGAGGRRGRRRRRRCGRLRRGGRRHGGRRGGRRAGPRGRSGLPHAAQRLPQGGGVWRHGHGHRTSRCARARAARSCSTRARDPVQRGRRVQHQHAQQENNARVGVLALAGSRGARPGRVRGRACNKAAGSECPPALSPRARWTPLGLPAPPRAPAHPLPPTRSEAGTLGEGDGTGKGAQAWERCVLFLCGGNFRGGREGRGVFCSFEMFSF